MLAKGSNGEDSTQTECNPTVPPRTTWSEASILGILQRSLIIFATH